MRVTNNMMFDSSIRNLNNNLQRLSAAQTQYSTQSKIQVPSDDPVIATRAIKYRSYVSQTEQYQKNTSDATSWMEVTDDALQSVSDYMTRLKELVTNGASDTNSTSSKTAIADEISEIKKGLVDTLNTSYAGRYVFAGYNTDKAPYALVTETLSSGDTVQKVTYKGQSLSVGGPVSSSISTSDILTFCDDNTAKTTPTYPNTGSWTLTVDGTAYTVDLSGVTDVSSLQTAIDSATDSSGTALGSNQVDVSANASGYLQIVADPSGTVSTLKAGVQSDLGFATAYTTGDAEQAISYHVSNGSEVKVNIEGQNVIGWSGDSSYGGYTSSGTNLFDTIDKILLGLNGESSYQVATCTSGTWTVTTQSSTSSSTLLSSCLDELETDLDRITKAQSVLGARMNYVESTDTRLSNNDTTYTKLQSDNEDIDIAKASVEVSSAESVYEAALSVTSKVTSKSLVDYLR